MEASGLWRVVGAIERFGLVLESDPHLPSVVAILTGRRPHGSWWAEPYGHDVFAVNRELAVHPDVLVAKLVSGKVTFVHRSLWAPLLAVGTARDRWQMEGLSPGARRLLDLVDQQGEVRTDRLPAKALPPSVSPADAARDLEKRLLVHSEQIHTEIGRHAKRLIVWPRWAARAGFVPAPVGEQAARDEIDLVLANLNRQFDGTGKLPWPKRRKA